MAIVFEANYSKKLGLPGYSSHQYSLTVRSELSDLSQVEAESKRLYGLLQTSVDREIQQTGLLPGHNGPSNGNGHDNGRNGNGSHNGNEEWQCSPKQKELILKIVEEHQLDKNEIEALARERFNTPVKVLNTMQASGLISELLERYPGKENGKRFNTRSYGKAPR